MKQWSKWLSIVCAGALALSVTGCSSTQASNSATESVTIIQSETVSAPVASSEEAVVLETTAAQETTVSETTAAEASTDTTSLGASVITILSASADNTEIRPGSDTVTIGNKAVELSGAYVIDGVDAVITGGTYTSTQTDQNVFLVINGGSLTLKNAVITKTGNAGANDSTRTSDVSDSYNFYGINSVILVVGADSSAAITNCQISSDCSGANAVFATAGAQVTVENVEIETTGNSSRGVYATYEGIINADHVSIHTTGAHCAPIATDRGGGYVTVTNSVVASEGDGSPCIYSTGEITVENVAGTAEQAQAAVIEGKNSITMANCEFTTIDGNNGVMLYQSGSGDAADSDATASHSSLTMANSVIHNQGDGAMFYITNTNAVINLEGGNMLESESGILVNAGTGRWGKDGSNGGTVTLNISGESVSDTISANEISTVQVHLSNGASCKGTTSGSVTITEE